MACGIDSVEGIDALCSETVWKVWNNFMAAFQRANPQEPMLSGIVNLLKTIGIYPVLNL